MSTLQNNDLRGVTESRPPRVLSLDIFRGVTMAVMIFVNALPEDGGLPWWTHHAHAEENVMTYVDMVFPFFLFIVGMSFPLSIAQRLKRNASLISLWMHVISRAVALVVLGLILANAEKCDTVRTGLSGSAWALLGLISAGLYLNIYPKSKVFPTYPNILRAAGLVGVALLLAIFRRVTPDGHTAWIDFSYPEILGLIGLSYLAVALLYIPTRRWSWAPPVWFILLLGLCITSTGRLIGFPDRVPLYFWPFGNGAMACIIMAGVMTSFIFLPADAKRNPHRAMFIAVCVGLSMLVAGRILTPLGISKIRATPTWSLYSIGAAILCFTLLYWICDLRGWTRWAFFVYPAGSNTLTTYLLPDLWYYLSLLCGFTFLDLHFIFGQAAVLKTIGFTLFILAIAAVLTRLKVRLQL